VLRLSAVTLVLLASACSLLNRDGPDASCADLQNGAANACADGIIATCSNGSITYKVCNEKSACSAPWQTAGRYRCTETEPAPNLVASVSGDDGGPSASSDGAVPGSDGSGGTDGNSTTSCTPPADEACGSGQGQGRRYCTDGHAWTECLVDNSNCNESKSGGWSSLANTAGGACSGKATGAVVACKACAGSVVCGATSNCAAPAGANLYACGKPGTVVKEPNTASGETYCLSTGNFMNRGAASGTELGPEVSLCDPPYKPGDDVETCTGGPGSAEVCYPSCATSYVRVCRTTGKWSACHRGSL
jgi:hypothetical protein